MLLKHNYASYSSEENEWMLWKTNSSISLDYNGELAFHINLSDFGEKCEEIGQWQIFWLNWFEDTNFDELQYKPNLRGSRKFQFLSMIMLKYYFFSII